MGPKVNVLWSQETRKVLYIEAGKDFVDLLLSILRMPTVTVLNLVIGEGLTAPGDKAYAGVVNLLHALGKLDGSALKVDKDHIVKPPVDLGVNVLRLTDSAGGATAQGSLYRCPHMNYTSGGYGNTATCNSTVWRTPGLCPGCSRYNLAPVTVQEAKTATAGQGADSAAQAGFVKENITFMITDNLDFYQTSTIKSITLLNKLGVKNMSDLRDMEVEVDQAMAVGLVKAALTSRTVLNDVFGAKLKAKAG